jgi:mono/diheme cytochrome c family protein
MSTHDEHNPAPQHSEDHDPQLLGIDYSEQNNVSQIHETLLREKPEPSDGMEPVPIFLIAIIAFVFSIGGFYGGRYFSSTDPMVYDENPGSSIVAAAKAGGPTTEVALDPIADLVKLGKRQYSNNCASCHQPTGLGLAGQYPPLAGSEWVVEAERPLIAILVHGLQGSVDVKGQTYNGAMPAWGKSMSDRQIAAVLTYIRQEWGNAAGPISPDQIKAIRTELEGRAKEWSEAELKALPKDPVPGGLTAAAPVAAKKS